MIRAIVTAWEFLTIIPVSQQGRSPAPVDLAGSMAWFPAVGLILGGILVAVDSVLSAVLSSGVVNVLLIVLLVVMTGGLHVDGLADTVDGLGGGRTPADRLRIMRDVHIGAIGVSGVVLALGLRYAALASLPAAHRTLLLLCMPLVGRWGMVVSALGMRYARTEGGLAHPFLERLHAGHVLWATAWTGLALTVAVGWLQAGVLAVLLVGLARAMAAAASRWFGGMTGDVLGAVNEVTEILFLVAAPVVVRLDWPPLPW